MQKVRIVSLEHDKPKVVAALHMLGALDLRKSKLDISDDRPDSHSSELSDSLIKVTGALQMLSPHPVKAERHMPADHIVKEVSKTRVLNEIYSLANERKLIEDDQKAIGYAEHIATALHGIRMDFARTKSDYLSYRAFEADSRSAKQVASAISRSKTEGVELNISKSGKNQELVLLVYDKKANVDDLLKGIKLNELDLSAKYLEGSPAEVLKALSSRRKTNDRRLSVIAARLAGISKSSYSRLSNLREMLEIELSRSEVSGGFKRTDNTFVVEGWVQKERVEELKVRIANVTRKKAYIEELEGDELAPTVTKRPKFLQPFDYMVSFYSVQRSDEIDPTWIFILLFPIFYGLMVTDVGYGFASLLLATYITKKTDPDGLMYNAAKIWQLNSFAAMFFGILSNQYFGFQLGYSTPFSFDWLKNTPEIIAISVLFGVLQVVIGLVIGIINSYNHGHKKMAYARFTSILVVLLGTVAVSGAFFGAFNSTITDISAAIAAVSLILTIVFSGSEATEVTNLITHPLSYARLMGFGLGSVIIAFLIDMAFTPHMSSGILVFTLYLVIFIALHFLNMVLSIFEGIVQGIRLNFVEFFSKFYIGNGVKFRPFSYRRIYTKE